MQMQADDVISLGLFPQSIRMMFTISSSCLLRERRGRERESNGMDAFLWLDQCCLHVLLGTRFWVCSCALAARPVEV